MHNEPTNSVVAFLGGLALGAGLMFYLDPDRGRRRRALARDKAVHLTHKTQDAVGAKARDIRNRAQGVIAESKSALSRTTEDDERQPV
ncbi:MAG: YtxH domain-containing protein [Burkholderiaceae bacterium]